MNYTCIPSSGGINNFARQQRFQPTLHRKYRSGKFCMEYVCG